jgi:catechol 2,3-dioxygenase-like lactoylglutathione lyase family enzyme
MIRFRQLGLLALAVLATAAHPSRVLAETLTFDHIQLAVPDPAKAVDWYVKYLGGTKTDSGDGVLFGPTRVSFSRTATSVPSADRVIDVIGFSFADLDATIGALQAAGTKIVMAPREIPNLFKIAYVEDPWGVKIEIVQDPQLLGFHHVHLRAAEPDTLVNWLLETVGGERGKIGGQLDALKYGRLWLLTEKSDQTPAPSTGSAINHLGWRVTNLDQTIAGLKAKGVKVTIEPRAVGLLRVAFVEGPGGLRVELVQQ